MMVDEAALLDAATFIQSLAADPKAPLSLSNDFQPRVKLSGRDSPAKQNLELELAKLVHF